MIWYGFYYLRSGNGVGPILTALEPTWGHCCSSVSWLSWEWLYVVVINLKWHHRVCHIWQVRCNIYFAVSLVCMLKHRIYSLLIAVFCVLAVLPLGLLNYGFYAGFNQLRNGLLIIMFVVLLLCSLSYLFRINILIGWNWLNMFSEWNWLSFNLWSLYSCIRASQLHIYLGSLPKGSFSALLPPFFSPWAS